MIMNKKVLIPIVILMIIGISSLALLLIHNQKKQSATDPTDGQSIATQPSDNGDITESTNSTESTLPTDEQIKEIKLIVRHKSGYEFEIKEHTTYAQFEYKFNDPPCSTILVEEVKYNQTALFVEEDEKVLDDVFAFGGINTTSAPTNDFNDLELVHFSFRGSQDWEIFGLKTNMSKEDVFKTLGAPTREYGTKYAYFIEYEFEKDGHNHTITISWNKDATIINTIEWLRDNLPVYENDILTEDDLNDMGIIVENQEHAHN